MSEARVAVAIPAFQAAGVVRDALDSLIAQTFDDWRAIVVDDGSTDGTIAAAAGVDPRVTVIPLEHSGLPAVARNAAIAATSSTYVAMLDADDVWYREKLARQVAVLDGDSSIGLVHSAYDALRGEERTPVIVARADGGADVFATLARANIVANSSVVVRRSLLEEHGPFDEDPALRGTEDYELWLRLATVTRFAYIAEPLLAYRVSAAGLGSDPRRMADGTLAAVTKVQARRPDRFEELGADYLRTLGSLRCITGTPGSGRADLRQAVRRRPLDLRAWAWLVAASVAPGAARRWGRRSGGRVGWRRSLL